MIDVRIVYINQVSDYNNLLTFIRKSHINSETVDELKQYLGLKCNKLIVEFPYADKDYLSTFYIHYAKKYKEYSKGCYRLHVFNNDDYFGFITLRHTAVKKIGRTYLHPSLLLDQNAYLMSGKFAANVVGSEASIECFPWMHQENDISTCAHVALWSTLRYFGNRQSNYADMTMGGICDKIQFNLDRKTPCRGLSTRQISNLLMQYNFSTLIRHKDKNMNARQYLNEILSYVESGLPLIGIMSKSEHAVCIIGHGEINLEYNDIQLRDLCERVEYAEKKTDIILSTRFIKSVIVNDDNYFPYRSVYCNVNDLSKNQEIDPFYGLDNVDYFVIPFYEKMQITYNEVYNIVVDFLIKNNLKNLPSPKILRIFITSSNSFKTKSLVNFTNARLKHIIARMNMPKFVWIVEISSVKNHKIGMVDGLIIIDATCSSLEPEPWIYMHDSKTVKYFNGKRLVKSSEVGYIAPIKRYTNNLEGYGYVKS